MVRAVFVGYDNRLNRLLAHWLSERTDLVGCIWIEGSATWKNSRDGRQQFLRTRIAKRGLLKALDEAAFHLYFHATVKRSRNRKASNQLIDEYWRKVGFHSWGPSIHTVRINDPEVLWYLDKLKPDVIFSHCIHQYFTKKIRQSARHGVFLWHIGITPEYKGLYSPFWTMHNMDFDNFGYSLISLNDKLDDGGVYVQGRLDSVDIRRDNHISIETQAILASLPGVATFIKQLENGTAQPISRPGAVPGYYSYPGMTDYIRQRWRVYRFERARRRQKFALAGAVGSEPES